jgi:hypothetical protein
LHYSKTKGESDENQDECDGGNQVGRVAEENSERICGEPPFKAAFPPTDGDQRFARFNLGSYFSAKI